MNETIAVIATASGISSIAIVRVSGSNALTIARAIAPRASLTPRSSDLASLYNAQGELIDRALVVYFQEPKSFTGEDIVEFQCHGGSIIAQEILESTLAYGARLAQPGEFSKRAFLNGKIDLSEAEAIAKIIEAQSVDAAKMLARQLKGELGRFVAESREALLRALAHSEVLIDYAEEDIPDDLHDGLRQQCDALIATMEGIIDSSKRRRGLIEGFRVAIIGKPNVGKSSLLNALLSYERAIVSDIAGTTRDTIEEQIRLGSHIVRLVDTAGIRQTNDTIEKIGVERSMSSISEADIVIALFDGSAPCDDEDREIIALLESFTDKELIVAINKSDLEQQFDTAELATYSPLTISAKNRFTKLTTHLQEQLDAVGGSDELMLVSTRQIDAVQSATDEIVAAKLPLECGELELFSYHIQEALKQLASITHPYRSDEILDKMFSEFCLGK